MPSPAFIDCPKDAWTKVATGVVTGQVWRMISTERYLQTYRLTGDAEPTEKEEGVAAFLDGNDRETISSAELIDVYLYSISENGRVRVDL